VAVALVLATTWWVTRPGPAVSPSESSPAGIGWQGATRSTDPHPEQATLRSGDARIHVSDSQPALPEASANLDSEQVTVAQYASEKYRLLLGDLHDLRAADVEKLRRSLLERELLAGAIKAAREANDPSKSDEILRQEAALAKVEGQIRSLLHPADHATYEALKDADLELFQLDDYARGISNVAPLSAADRDSVLRTKLAYKARYGQLLQDSGLLRDNLSAAERDYAYAVTARALEDYKRSYLSEVRQFLADDEQFLLLSNYENTEFTAELAKLRSMANGGEHREVVTANTR
jgi:hypothetical protein